MESGRTLPPTDKTDWAVSLAAGVLITLACFALLFWGLGYLMPRFLRFAESGQSGMLPVLGSLVACAGGLLRMCLKRRARTKRPRWPEGRRKGISPINLTTRT
jgi:hypothetical protein